MSIVGVDENLSGITARGDVYPAIDPKEHFASKTFKDKVVVVTGASRGLGEEIALHYGRAGAMLMLVARNQILLDGVKAKILEESPDARILTAALDVRDVEKTKAAVEATVNEFGKLDVVVTNAGAMQNIVPGFASQDPSAWWDVVDINVRGTYNFVHYAIPHLQKTKGNIVVISSKGSLLRLPGLSDYAVSKIALNRFVEFIALEYPDVKAFALHPGQVETDMGIRTGLEGFTDAPALSAATSLYLTSGKADWLNGRFVFATWDLAEVESKYKAKILEFNGLVHKLSIPEL